MKFIEGIKTFLDKKICLTLYLALDCSKLRKYAESLIFDRSRIHIARAKHVFAFGILFNDQIDSEKSEVYLTMADTGNADINFCYVWMQRGTHIKIFIKTLPLAFLPVPHRC